MGAADGDAVDGDAADGDAAGGDDGAPEDPRERSRGAGGGADPAEHAAKTRTAKKPNVWALPMS